MLNQFRKRLIQTTFDTRCLFIGTISLSWSSGSSRSPQSFQKNFDKIRTTGTIDGLDRLNDKRRGVVDQRCFWVRHLNFCACFANKPNIMMHLIGERTSDLAICFFSRFCGVEKLQEFYEDIEYHIVDTWIFENRVSKNINSFYRDLEI